MAKTPTPISSSDACGRLGISRSTLTYWTLTGRITPIQTIASPSGKTAMLLWDPRDVDRLAKDRSSSPRGAA